MHYVCDILILTVRTKSSFWSAYGSRWYRTAHHKHVGSWNVELDAIILQVFRRLYKHSRLELWLQLFDCWLGTFGVRFLLSRVTSGVL